MRDQVHCQKHFSDLHPGVTRVGFQSVNGPSTDSRRICPYEEATAEGAQGASIQELHFLKDKTARSAENYWIFLISFLLFSDALIKYVTVLKVFLGSMVRSCKIWQHQRVPCDSLLGIWKGNAGEYVVNWLKGNRILMLTFVNTFLSFVF